MTECSLCEDTCCTHSSYMTMKRQRTQRERQRDTQRERERERERDVRMWSVEQHGTRKTSCDRSQEADTTSHCLSVYTINQSLSQCCAVIGRDAARYGKGRSQSLPKKAENIVKIVRLGLWRSPQLLRLQVI